MEMSGQPARVAVRTAADLRQEGKEDRLPPELPYADELVDAVARQREAIDRLVGGSGTRWRVDRMSALDVQILRVAVAEMLASHEDPPTPVVIDEAVEVAREFGGKSSPSFINGILDAVAHAVRGVAARSVPGRGAG